MEEVQALIYFLSLCLLFMITAQSCFKRTVLIIGCLRQLGLKHFQVPLVPMMNQKLIRGSKLNSQIEIPLAQYISDDSFIHTFDGEPRLMIFLKAFSCH